jgi:hypothetical protein
MVAFPFHVLVVHRQENFLPYSNVYDGFDIHTGFYKNDTGKGSATSARSSHPTANSIIKVCTDVPLDSE